MRTEEEKAVKPGVGENGKKCSSGFTLIELLAVVAVIAILVSIAVPVITGAMEKAKAATCLANREIVQREATIAWTGGEDYDIATHQQQAKDENMCPSGGSYTITSVAGIEGAYVVTCSKHPEGEDGGEAVSSASHEKISKAIQHLLTTNYQGFTFSSNLDSSGYSPSGRVATFSAILESTSGSKVDTAWHISTKNRSNINTRSFEVYIADTVTDDVLKSVTKAQVDSGIWVKVTKTTLDNNGTVQGEVKTGWVKCCWNTSTPAYPTAVLSNIDKNNDKNDLTVWSDEKPTDATVLE